MKSISSPIRFCIALTLLFTFILEGTAQTRWYKFISPNNDFSIDFPGEPKHESHAGSVTDPPLELYTFIFRRHLINVGYKDLPSAPQTPEQRASALSGAIKSQLDWINKMGGQLFRQRPLEDGGVEFDFSGKLEDGTPTYNRDRIYVYGTRYYQLRCLSVNPQGLDESIASQFLNSFRFNGAITSTSKKTKSRSNKINRMAAP